MADIEKVRRGIERCLKHTCPSVYSKEYEECEYTVGLHCGQDRLLWEVLDLLKEQDDLLRKLQKDKDKLCLEVSEWKHKFHDRPLKEQECRDSFTVIDTKTGKEADEYNIALHEDWAKHLCYCDMDGWAIQDDGSLLLLDECGRYAFADRERFKVVWNG